MAKRIEEIFNDCFERLLLGESLESCLSRYPEYAAELDSMLRTAFDVKRKAFPVQPRPEFKYWARIRMQNAQYYGAPEPAEEKVSASNLRRNLAFSLTALLILVIASSGTAAASSQAMPDEPLYGVKIAVEQAQLTLTTSDIDKAELYAQLAEKRAQEIAVMADKGKTDQVVATTAKLNYQLDQANALLANYEAELAASAVYSTPAATTGSTAVPPPSTPPAINPVPSPMSTPTTPPPVTPGNSAAVSGNTTAVVTENTTNENTTMVGASVTSDNKSLARSKRFSAFTQNQKDVDNAETSIDASTDNSLTILENALDKAPESVKSSLNDAIQRTRRARAHITLEQTPSDNQTLSAPPVNTTTNTFDQQQNTTTYDINNAAGDNSNQQGATTSVTNSPTDTNNNQQGPSNYSPDRHRH
ncbi:MAG: DUF5667 domain-containing protein [Dehalococcoidia bacterium]